MIRALIPMLLLLLGSGGVGYALAAVRNRSTKRALGSYMDLVNAIRKIAAEAQDVDPSAQLVLMEIQQHNRREIEK